LPDVMVTHGCWKVIQVGQLGSHTWGLPTLQSQKGLPG
jgi:hypothetical protein